MDTDQECSAELYRKHVAAFVSSFVERDGRDRWLNFLVNRPKQLYKNSHKLHDRLDKTRCTEAGHPIIADLSVTGMFCDFHHDSPPLLITAQRAIELGTGHDAIFSIVPGKQAIYFFHEDFVMECRRSVGLGGRADL